jgi:lipase chaperone LimK
MAFILDPFFGKKIYYGGYDRIIYKLNERTSKITNDNYLSEEEKRKLLQELKHRIEQIQDDKYQEIQHIEYMKNSK